MFDCIHDLVDQLQGNPYDYMKSDSEDDNDGDEEKKPEPQNNKFALEEASVDELIPYTDLKKGTILGLGRHSRVYIAYTYLID